MLSINYRFRFCIFFFPEYRMPCWWNQWYKTRGTTWLIAARLDLKPLFSNEREFSKWLRCSCVEPTSTTVWWRWSGGRLLSWFDFTCLTSFDGKEMLVVCSDDWALCTEWGMMDHGQPWPDDRTRPILMEETDKHSIVISPKMSISSSSVHYN